MTDNSYTNYNKYHEGHTRLRHTLKIMMSTDFVDPHNRQMQRGQTPPMATDTHITTYRAKFAYSEADFANHQTLPTHRIIIDKNNVVWKIYGCRLDTIVEIPVEVYGIFVLRNDINIATEYVNNHNGFVDTRPFKRSYQQMMVSRYYTTAEMISLPRGYTNQFGEEEDECKYGGKDKCCEMTIKQGCDKGTCGKKAAALSLPLDEVLHEGTAERIVTVDTQYHNVDVYTGICDKRVVWVEDNDSKLGVAAPFMKEDIIEFLA